MSEIERIMSQVVKKHCGDYDCILPEREIDNTDFYRGNSESCKKCAYNIILQALQEKLEREKQQAECHYCHGNEVPYQETGYAKLSIGTLGRIRVLQVESDGCPPFAHCCMKDVLARSAFRINYCPECGRKLVEE